jgi:hypothetical protein
MYTIKWNLEEFGRELNRYLKANDGALVNVVNKKAWWIAHHAKEFTPRATKTRILADMGARRTYRITKQEPKSQFGRRGKIKPDAPQGLSRFGWARPPGLRGNTYGYYLSPNLQKREAAAKRRLGSAPTPTKQKTWRARAKPIEFTNDTAVNIIQARRHEKGEKPLTQVEAKKAARRMINAKTRAVGTLRAGWHGILKRMASTAKEQYGYNVSHETGGMRVVKGVGEATAANRFTLRNPRATLTYVLQHDKMSGIHPWVEKAANMGISKERGSMRAYAAKKLQEIANKHTGNVSIA